MAINLKLVALDELAERYLCCIVRWVEALVVLCAALLGDSDKRIAEPAQRVV